MILIHQSIAMRIDKHYRFSLVIMFHSKVKNHHHPLRHQDTLVPSNQLMNGTKNVCGDNVTNNLDEEGIGTKFTEA